MENSDIFFVEQVQKGEVEAYSELVLRYQKPIYNLMFRFCHSTEDAAELTQDVFCNAFERLDRFATSKPFFPWLYTLAMNHGRDWARRNSKKSKGLDNYSQLLTQNPRSLFTDDLEQRQLVDQIFYALSKMEYEKREILLLKYKRGFSNREIGEVFNLSTSAVKMRIHRAIATLQDLLQSG